MLLLKAVDGEASEIHAIAGIAQLWRRGGGGHGAGDKRKRPVRKIRVPDQLEGRFRAAPQTCRGAFKQTKGRVEQDGTHVGQVGGGLYGQGVGGFVAVLLTQYFTQP